MIMKMKLFLKLNYLLSLLALALYLFFGHGFIEKVYKGEAFFFNKIISSQSLYPLEYYFSKWSGNK
ncbi:MAG: hypothetical protein A3I73_06000 [Omnitrophica bacterium RIFCSPLOWO2_02_FULL_45_16]|nr:MAG: hypothetical protein A3C51_01705 [Omnitrophica bacterium RIFCSPHIGHO2_02_FULL_46_20]OGX01106.1 MAG: hypothetical protein A3I73_06000 [Omnitrophica bacterium RIFCSPLOWO2_02_FULL_45_16]